MWRWMFGLVVCGLMFGPVRAEQVTVYAAASLTSVLQALSVEAKKHDVDLRLSFGGSSVMAKQIMQGAPADIYFSANVRWMDYLEKEGLLESDTRVNLVGNDLVVIVPKGEGFEMVPEPSFDFAGAFEGRLALGDPSHVPAGMYAKEVLEKLGWWDEVKDRLAPMGDVRRALALVALGECSAGIVYATDANVSKDVDVVGVLPDALLGSPIVYPMAVVKGQRTLQVEKGLEFFQSRDAMAIFEQYGFRVLTENALDK